MPRVWAANETTNHLQTIPITGGFTSGLVPAGQTNLTAGGFFEGSGVVIANGTEYWWADDGGQIAETDTNGALVGSDSYKGQPTVSTFGGVEGLVWTSTFADAIIGVVEGSTDAGTRMFRCNRTADGGLTKGDRKWSVNIGPTIFAGAFDDSQSSNLGLEGITFIPDALGAGSEDGVFLVTLQESTTANVPAGDQRAKLFRFRANGLASAPLSAPTITALEPTGEDILVPDGSGGFTPPGSDYRGITADLYYDESAHLLYILYSAVPTTYVIDSVANSNGAGSAARIHTTATVNSSNLPEGGAASCVAIGGVTNLNRRIPYWHRHTVANYYDAYEEDGTTPIPMQGTYTSGGEFLPFQNCKREIRVFSVGPEATTTDITFRYRIPLQQESTASGTLPIPEGLCLESNGDHLILAMDDNSGAASLNVNVGRRYRYWQRGRVSGGGDYTNGQTAVITAYPAPGSRVKEWRKDGVVQATRGNTLSFTVGGSDIYVAVEFEMDPGYSSSARRLLLLGGGM